MFTLFSFLCPNLGMRLSNAVLATNTSIVMLKALFIKQCFHFKKIEHVHFKSTIKCFKEVKIDKWLDFATLISPHRLLC